MNHFIKLSAISAGLLLAGCGDDTSSELPSSAELESHIQQALERDTTIEFTLLGSDAAVPLPSYTLMNTIDGTLDLPTNGDDSLSNPAAAMSTMDGWSTSMPINLSFTGAGLSDGIVPSGVHLVELTEGLTGQPTPKNILQQNVDFVVVSDSATDSLTIVLQGKELNPSSEYILAVTNEVADENGEPVGTSSSYATLKSDSRTYTDEPFATLQAVTQGTEALFSAVGVDADSIIYSTWFSTQSVGETFFATKGATALGLAQGNLGAIWKDAANPNNVDLTAAYTLQFTSSEDYATALAADTNFTTYFDSQSSIDLKQTLQGLYLQSGNQVTVSKGVVMLPHYLEQGEDWSSQPFVSAMPSLAIVSNALADPQEQANIGAQLVAAGVDTTMLATELTEQAKLIGLELTKSDGTVLDADRFITRYAPVPKIKSLQAVEFLLFTPSGDADDWPVAIYQHGITSAKENAYFMAANIAQQGIAVIAIDMPLHGSRSLDAERSANADVTAYLNLSNIPVARDNFRQSVLDILGLRAALSYSKQAMLLEASPLANVDLVTSPPTMVGHSLGGMVAISTVANANRSLGTPSADALFNFSGLAAKNSGGHIVELLLGSDSYGNLIKHNVALAASTDYQGFTQSFCVNLTESECFTAFTQAAPEAIQALEAGFNQFAYATQTVLDSIDPFTNASYLLENPIPMYFSQVAGDDTVPNNVPNRGFAGTEPLAAKLGLTVIDSASTTPTDSNFIRFSDVSTHSTFVFPQDPTLADQAAHAVMTTHMVDFIQDGTLDLPISPTTLE
ncbi:VolA/Pla-1 family phospholipase [Vibrio agarivorans]|uniref:VolA/Pla-1 family phospholipase n=1 Tax=Vibrio agarivorans TaxID=153622 RepID=UPI00222E72F9|nr:VolA/Pla-1 family phospholipase [Vibrio agarivorans]